MTIIKIFSFYKFENHCSLDNDNIHQFATIYQFDKINYFNKKNNSHWAWGVVGGGGVEGGV